MSQRHISVRGARERNFKNISPDIPREKLVVITGVSGSVSRVSRSTRSMPGACAGT